MRSALPKARSNSSVRIPTGNRSIVEGSEEVYYVTSDPTSSHEGSFSDSTTLCDLLFGSVPILSTPVARIKTSNKRSSKLLWDPYLQASYFFITVLFKRG